MSEHTVSKAAAARVTFEEPSSAAGASSVKERSATTTARIVKGSKRSIIIGKVTGTNPPPVSDTFPPTHLHEESTFNLVFTESNQPSQMSAALATSTVPSTHGKSFVAFCGTGDFGRNSDSFPNSIGGKTPDGNHYTQVVCPPPHANQHTFVFWKKLFDLNTKSLPSNAMITQILESHFAKLPSMTHATGFIHPTDLEFFEKYMGMGKFASYFAEVISVTNMFTHFTSDYLGYKVLDSTAPMHGSFTISNPIVETINPLQFLSTGLNGKFFDKRGKTNSFEWLTVEGQFSCTIIFMVENQPTPTVITTRDGIEVPIEEIGMEHSQDLIDAMVFNGDITKIRDNFSSNTLPENSLIMDHIEADGLKYIMKTNPLLAFLKQTSEDRDITMLINHGRLLQSQLNKLVIAEANKHQMFTTTASYDASGFMHPPFAPLTLSSAPSCMAAPYLDRSVSEFVPQKF